MSPDSQLSGHTVCKASSSISALGRVLGFSPEHPQVDKWYSIAIGRMFSMVFQKNKHRFEKDMMKHMKPIPMIQRRH